jgi:hypothetical protein
VSKFNPFFIGSNLCLEKEDISTLDRFLSSVSGNIGNSYITYALMKTLFGGLVKTNHIQSIYQYDFFNSDNDVALINSECTHVFLILQDQIRISESYGLKLPYGGILDFIRRLNKPVIVAGIGSNNLRGFQSGFHKQLSPDLINFLRVLSGHCESMGIRGHYTEEVLHNLGITNVDVIGCPSFYEMGPDRTISKKVPVKPKVLLSNPMVALGNLDTVVQDEKNIMQVIAFKGTPPPHYNRFHTFPDIMSWKTFCSTYDFVIGTRVHGAILAINSGTCSVVLNPDSRAREMCELLKIPYHPELLNEPDVEKIYSACSYQGLNDHYPDLYERYVRFLSKNHLKPFDSQAEYDYVVQPRLELHRG